MVFLGLMPIPILGSRKTPISDISADNVCVCIISAECDYQILVTKKCNGGRISYILTKFIPNISALNTGEHICRIHLQLADISQ